MKLTKEQKQLVLENIGLVRYIISHTFKSQRNLNRVYNLEDLFQTGCEWLCLAAQRFDKNYKVTFGSFAGPYISGGIKRFINKNQDFQSIGYGRLFRVFMDYRSKYDYLSDLEVLDLMRKDGYKSLYSLLPVLSIDYEFIDSSDNNVLLFSEIIADSSVDIEHQYLDKETYEEIYSIYPKIIKLIREMIFSKNPTINKTRQCILAEYINYKANNSHITYEMLGNKFNLTKQQISKIVKVAIPLLKDKYFEKYNINIEALI